MELIDSHCHLQFESLASDLEAVIQRAEQASVGKMICVGTTLADSVESVNFASQFPGVWAAAGVHPHEASELLAESGGAAKLNDLLKSPKVVAIGEIGLDYYKNYSPKDEQLKALRTQIETGLSSGLPFIFHIRDAAPNGRQAWDDFWPVYDSYQGLRGVVHSFTAHQPQLEQALSRGLYVSLNGIMTFTKYDEQLAAAKQIPSDRLLLETDAPFLTPAPERGKTCEPRHIRRVAEFLAELRGENLEELAAATTANAGKLFALEQHE